MRSRVCSAPLRAALPPGNVIPASRISPQAQFFLPYLPTANVVVGSTNYSAETNNLLQHLMRGDTGEDVGPEVDALVAKILADNGVRRQ